ncbi:hypothetical protein PTI98_012309 [Pleurotus ostreatus]|nr:hypothetical protein PTI98_012309 [Pleurotus ostreatus]
MSASKGVALVTGAGRGIGRAIALRLARDGYSLALNDTSPNRAAVAAVQSEIAQITYSGRPAKAVGVPADVTDEGQVQEMVRRTVEELGAVDVLRRGENADEGVVADGRERGHTQGAAESGRDVIGGLRRDVRGERARRLPLLQIRGAADDRAAPAERGAPASTGCSIIGAASVTSKQAWAGLSAYSASKWAVRGLTQASALELAPYGIRVNAYAPGLVDTKMVERIAVESNREHSRYIAEESRNIPLKRLGTPDDVANLVAFLVSDKASYITGQSVSVNGGAFFD